MIENLKKIPLVIVGLVIMSLGIVLYLKSGLGANPLTVFTEGTSKVLGISVGRASQFIMFSLIIIVFFVDRKRLGLGTIIHAILVGFLMDVFMEWNWLNPESMISAYIILGLGVFLFGVGLALYVCAGLGEGPIDALMIILHLRLKKDIKWVRIVMDLCLIIIGFLLGGHVGIGTIIGVVFTGPIIENTLKLIKNQSLFKLIRKKEVI
ncbi:MAG TPA: hypothetical protein VEG39_08225 [Clostridia bacterium]|nr:hypothetical protein [Clostridia bacterium]